MLGLDGNAVTELGITGSNALVFLILLDAGGWISTREVAARARLAHTTAYRKLCAMSLVCYAGWCVEQDEARPTHWRLVKLEGMG